MPTKTKNMYKEFYHTLQSSQIKVDKNSLSGRLYPRYENSFQVEDIQPTEEVRNNPRTSVKKYLTKSFILVFNRIIEIASINQNVYPSHKSIAKDIGTCTRTVRRAIKQLKILGLLNYLGRPHKPCLYRPSSFLLKEWVRDALKSLIPALAWVSTTFVTTGQFCQPTTLQAEMSANINKDSFSLLIVSKSLTIVNYDKNKGAKVSKPETVMNPRIEKLRELLCLEFHEANGLSKYPDKILDKAIKSIDRIKAVQNKSAYLFALCESELHPKPAAEQAYKHLKSKYPSTSDNSSSINPPSRKVYVSKPIVLEKVSDEKIGIVADRFKELAGNSKTGLDFSTIFNCFKNFCDSTRSNE